MGRGAIGVKVRIFVPYREIPFGGHPTLRTAMVLRNLQIAQASRSGHAGMPFAIVPIKHLSTLQSLNLDLRKIYEYLDRQEPKCQFYYVTRDTQDPGVGLRTSLSGNHTSPSTA